MCLNSRISVCRWLILLLCSGCKFLTPESFLDKIEGSLSLTNLQNVRNGYAGGLWSGVVTGCLLAGAGGAKISFDDGIFKPAIINASGWKIFIPNSVEGIAGKNSWVTGSTHRLRAKLCDAGQNCGTEIVLDVSFTVAQNRDVNADGNADIVVGAYQNQGSGAADKGAAYIFYGSDLGITTHVENAVSYSCSGPPDCTTIQNPDEDSGGGFGFSVSVAGDVNKDGYADIIVGAQANQGSGAGNKGAAYIFYGSDLGITTHAENAMPYSCSGFPDCTVIQNPDNEASGGFGYSVSFAGDVNKDGYADIIVGAYSNQGSGAGNKGAAYIFYGSASGITAHPENTMTYSCLGPPDCTVIQNPDNESSGQFGYSVSGAGDVNKDGYGEVIIGAYGNQGSGVANKGSAYVFYGSASGITSHPEDGMPYSCLGPPDCTVIQNPDNESNGGFGYSVSFAGDVNKDGYDDVIAGAFRNQGAGSPDKGAAYVFYGSASGITTHVENATPYTCSGPPDCTTIQNPDNENGGNFGYSVGLGGDVNGDGYADVIIGAYLNQGGGAADKGAAYVFYGSASGITTHVENATPYTCSGPPDCTVIQNPADENSGGFGNSVAFVSDVNKDGYSDIIVGAYGNQGSGGAADKGSAYIFYGSASGITTHIENATPYVCSGPPDCTVIQNPDDENTGNFGYSVSRLDQNNHEGDNEAVHKIGELLAIFRREEFDTG